jgi:hypothetical protein
MHVYMANLLLIIIFYVIVVVICSRRDHPRPRPVVSICIYFLAIYILTLALQQSYST